MPGTSSIPEPILRSKADPAFSVNDFATLCGLPPLLVLAWAVPERFWPRIGRVCAPLAARMLPAELGPGLRAARQSLREQGTAATTEAVLDELGAGKVHALLQLLRDYRPGRWKPDLRLVGFDHVAAAHRRGRGAVLWVAKSIYGDLVAKMAFHRAGLAVSHLSRATHGFSGSRFGRRYLNRVQTAAEDRYLRQRVLLSHNGAAAALELLAAGLRGNGVVSITANDQSRRPVVAPFLGRSLALAPGAAVLAHRTGATLLPAFAFRDESGVLTVTVGPPVAVAHDAARETAVADAAREYATRLEPYVLRYPGQWLGWAVS